METQLDSRTIYFVLTHIFISPSAAHVTHAWKRAEHPLPGTTETGISTLKIQPSNNHTIVSPYILGPVFLHSIITNTLPRDGSDIVEFIGEILNSLAAFG